jgi:CBS domain-containing protein
MSPRAAWRLEGLGFERVYDYVPGESDWSASGLPRQGKMASVPNIGEAARRDVPTCAPTEKLGVVRERLRKAGWDRCVVINKERIVLGLRREKELSSDHESPVEETMRNGPATFRPNEPVGKMAKRMHDRGATAVLVTTSDGRLVGLLHRKDVEQLAGVRP